MYKLKCIYLQAEFEQKSQNEVMITDFIVENYRSIDGEIRLSFMADTSIKDMDNRGYTTVANTRVLNAKAFYGANSCGKSNVFRLLE